MRTVDRVEKLASAIIEPDGYEVVDVEFKKEGSRKVLRVYVDRLDGSITLDEISDITRLISDRLDEEDFIEEEYLLELSSPGITRIIKKEKDFIRFSGRKVDVRLFRALEGRKKFTAVLKGYEDGAVIMDLDGKELRIPQKDISKINLSFDFKF